MTSRARSIATEDSFPASSRRTESRATSIAGSRRSVESLSTGQYERDRLLEEDQKLLLGSLDDREREDLAKQLVLTSHLNHYYDKTGDRHLELGQDQDAENDESDSGGQRAVGQDNRENQGGRSSRAFKAPSSRRGWRAWPLPTYQTPRLELSDSPSSSLRNTLVSTILRQAKEQMRSREGEKVFSADDETSAAVCNPAVEKVMVGLDYLLVSLYRSREGYAADESLQDMGSMFRKRRYRGVREDGEDGEDKIVEKGSSAISEGQNNDNTNEEKEDGDGHEENDYSIESRQQLPGNLETEERILKAKRRKVDAGPSSLPFTRAYRQGSQRLLSATDVFQHALIQSFPRGVLHRASQRLDQIFQYAPEGVLAHKNYLTLLEANQDCLSIGTLGTEVDTSSMASLGRLFLETDADRLAIGDRLVNRSMWEAWAAHKKQSTEGGAFGRDGFLVEVPAQSRTKESRRQRYQEKKRQELDAEYG
ncbi:hypothetical protein ABW19_dt0204036 [Dactylella cylindrospora]|nr:hypothetical protein ABW19_dt0204036 [Dactylella cylindrospora]